MLFGALLVVAPAASAGAAAAPVRAHGVYGVSGKPGDSAADGKNVTLKCEAKEQHQDLDDGGAYDFLPIDDRDNALLNFGSLTTLKNNTTAFTEVVTDGDRFLDWTSETAVTALIYKKANYSAVFATGGASGGRVQIVLPVDPDLPNRGFNVTFCGAGHPAPTQDMASLEIEKKVAGDAAPQDGWSFDFSGLPGDATQLSETKPSTGAVQVQAGTVTVSESYDDATGAYGAGTTEIACEGTDSESVTGRSVTLVLVKDATVKCTFTNTFTADPAPAKLTVVKKVDGAPSTPPATFAFTSDAGTFDPPGLGNGDSETFENLAADTYTVGETTGRAHELSKVQCVDAAQRTRDFVRTGDSIDVTLAAGDDVTCTFTNTRRRSAPVIQDPIVVEDPVVTEDPVLSEDPVVIEKNLATVVIREAVVGTPAHKVPAAWAFAFSTELTSEMSATARDIFELREDDPETIFSVEPGSSLNVVQDDVPTVDGGVWTFLGTECEGADADDVTAVGQAVTVTPDADDVITCTFTTEFTALQVLPAPAAGPVATPTPVETPASVEAPIPAPVATPAPRPAEVLGETVTRTPTGAVPAPAVLGVQTTRLADTGTTTFGLAGFGLMLLTLGGALVAASRLGRLGEG